MVSWSGFAKRFKGITKSVIFKQGWGLGRLSIDKGELEKVNYKACVFHFCALHTYIYIIFFFIIIFHDGSAVVRGKRVLESEGFFLFFFFYEVF